MRYTLIGIVLIVHALTAAASKDSLWTIWQDETMEDTIRLDAAYDLIAEYYMYDNPDSAVILAKEQLDIAIAINNKTFESLYLSLLAGVNYNIGELEESFKYYNKADTLFQQLGETKKSLLCARNIAVIYDTRGEYTKAIPLLRNIYSTQKELNYIVDIPETLRIMGGCYLYTGNYNLALQSFLEAFSLAKKLGLSEDESYLYHPIASCYIDLKEYDLAEKYLNEIITKRTNIGDSLNLSYEYAALGQLYEEKKQLDTATIFLRKAVELAKQDKQLYSISDNLLPLCKNLLLKNDPDFLKYVKELTQVSIELEQGSNEGYSYMLLGKYYSKQGAYSKAISLCEKGHRLIVASENLEMQEETCACLYKAYKAISAPKKALFYHEKYMTIKDSLYSADKTKKLTKMTLEHEFGETQLADSLQHAQEVALLNTNNFLLASQRKYYLLTILGATLLALLSSLFFWRTKKQNQQIQQQKEELEQLNLSKDRLFAIIGHDLRKPALAFRGISKKARFLIDNKEYDTLSRFGESLEKSAHSLNNSLDNLLNWALQQRNVLPYQPKSVNVQEITKEVYEIFAPIAADKHIELNFKVDATTKVFSDPAALTTIVRNLVDNAIKFTSEGGLIVLDAQKTQKRVRLRIKDSGIGMSATQIAQLFELQQNKSKKGTQGEIGTGIGMALVHDLVELNKGTITVKSKIQQGTTIEVVLPAA